MAYSKSKYVADLIALVGDLETVYFKAEDVFKRFDTFSDEVNNLANGSTTWPGTNLTKDDALDLIIAVKEFFYYATNHAVDTRDNLASFARARNLQS
jgi:hypothetical protein